jgi:hypothetical protein
MLCPEKQVFSTLRGAAEEALAQLIENERRLRAYSCSVCTSYHLTSKPLDGRGEITDEMVRRLASSVGARERSVR